MSAPIALTLAYALVLMALLFTLLLLPRPVTARLWTLLWGKKRGLFPVYLGSHHASRTCFQDVDDWLGGHFGNAALLRYGLLESNAAIVGSRVLDFFSPGFCTDTKSDWDFSVPNDPTCVWRLMTRLEQCGVVWQSIADRLVTTIARSFDVVAVDRFRNPPGFLFLYSFQATLGDVVDAHMAQVLLQGPNNRIARELFEMRGQILAIAALGGDISSFRINAYLIDGERVLLFFPADGHARQGDDYFWDRASVVDGVVTHNGRVSKVQIIATAGGYWSHILNFHSSCVQGFVDGNIAALLYPEETARREFFTWKTTHPRARDEAARAKYRARGFTPVTLPAGADVRSLGTGPTMVVNLDAPNPRWTSQEHRDRTFAIHNRPSFVWERQDDRLVPLAGEPAHHVVAMVDGQHTTLEAKLRYCRRHGIRLVED
ncbi:hypothetical protein SLS60_007540 [Paraconiothyrium brasiliense]|uniref:Uncharacterized protein n=1 Tax=Paraconiothyrium brasiliense TaxID=300254 RepID=A0ABR3R5P5_9PLEO